MESLDRATRGDRFFSPPRILAAGLACAGGYVIVRACAAGGAERAPSPYVWPDVARVYFLSALPLAALLASYARRRVSAAGLTGLSAVCLGAGMALLFVAASAELTRPSTSEAFGGLLRAAMFRTAFFRTVMFRVGPAAGLVTAVAMAWAALVDRPPRRDDRAGFDRGGLDPRQPGRQATVAGIFALAALLFVPATYVAARCRHDAIQLAGLLQQSRLGEAQTLVQGMLRLAPDAEFEGRSLRSRATDVKRATAELEARVAIELPAAADGRLRLNRARELAMLGRTEAAVDALQNWPQWLHSPAALNLCGTIQETNGQWQPALDFYLAGQRAWQAAPPDEDRTAGLVQATTGIAYCERKLGRYAEAEAAYLERLALSPTAETHFLLASFYEDAQQTSNARTHARLAMALAPERYRQPGKKLIDKLDTLHFGCLSGFFADQASPGSAFSAAGGTP